ncbi:MAG: hypothetical protein HQL70_02240 [Magnetococcales bacterium]|nr:hypothetical protein [Magnetococcales bacterium]
MKQNIFLSFFVGALLSISICISPGLLWANRGSVADLVSELDSLIESVDSSKLATPAFIIEVKKILKKYRPAIQYKLLVDTFSDGNFTHNPEWKVLRGIFRVDGNGALLSTTGVSDDSLKMQKGGVVAKKSAQNNEIGQIMGLMQVLSGEGKTAKPTNKIKRSIIYSNVQTPNSFDLSLSFRSGHEQGHGEVGLFVDNPQKTGYRLLLSADPMVSQSISLIRYVRGRSQVLRGSGGIYLGNGLSHQIRWRRLESGMMSVWVDGVEMLRVRDASLWNGFSGLVLVNDRGEFAFDNISLQSIE